MEAGEPESRIAGELQNRRLANLIAGGLKNCGAVMLESWESWRSRRIGERESGELDSSRVGELKGEDSRTL